MKGAVVNRICNSHNWGVTWYYVVSPFNSFWTNFVQIMIQMCKTRIQISSVLKNIFDSLTWTNIARNPPTNASPAPLVSMIWSLVSTSTGCSEIWPSLTRTTGSLPKMKIYEYARKKIIMLKTSFVKKFNNHIGTL